MRSHMHRCPLSYHSQHRLLPRYPQGPCAARPHLQALRSVPWSRRAAAGRRLSHGGGTGRWRGGAAAGRDGGGAAPGRQPPRTKVVVEDDLYCCLINQLGEHPAARLVANEVCFGMKTLNRGRSTQENAQMIHK